MSIGVNGPNFEQNMVLDGNGGAVDSTKPNEPLYNAEEANQVDEVNLNNNKAAQNNVIDTLDELNEALKNPEGKDVSSIKNAIQELEMKLQNLKREADEIENQIRESQNNIKEANNLKTKLEKELAREEKNLKTLLENQEKTKNELETLRKQFEECVQTGKEAEEELKTLTTQAEQEAKQAKDAYIEQIKAEYNEATDGDWNTYLDKKMGEFNYVSPLEGRIKELQGVTMNMQAAQDGYGESILGLEHNLTELEGKISKSNDSIKTLKADIKVTEQTISAEEQNLATKNNELDAKNTEIEQTNSALTAKNDLLNTIDEAERTNAQGVSETEWQAVQENQYNLTEKMENGNPRFIFGLSNIDDSWHIFDMNKGSSVTADETSKGVAYTNQTKPTFALSNNMQTLIPLTTTSHDTSNGNGTGVTEGGYPLKPGGGFAGIGQGGMTGGIGLGGMTGGIGLGGMTGGMGLGNLGTGNNTNTGNIGNMINGIMTLCMNFFKAFIEMISSFMGGGNTTPAPTDPADPVYEDDQVAEENTTTEDNEAIKDKEPTEENNVDNQDGDKGEGEVVQDLSGAITFVDPDLNAEGPDKEPIEQIEVDNKLEDQILEEIEENEKEV